MGMQQVLEPDPGEELDALPGPGGRPGGHRRDVEDERVAPDEEFELTSEVFAVEGDQAVARVEVLYRDPRRREEFRDVWLMRFEDGCCDHFEDGCCDHFEEWPFWPEKSYTASAS